MLHELTDFLFPNCKILHITGTMQNKQRVGKVEILEISRCDKPEMDLIFVHGLDGDERSTWQADDKPASFWPDWLG